MATNDDDLSPTQTRASATGPDVASYTTAPAENESSAPGSSDNTAKDSVSKSPSGSKPAPTSTMTREDWRSLPMKFAKVYLFVFCIWLGILSVYWGALYRREDREKNMKILVAIEDSSFELANSTTVDAILGPYLELTLQTKDNRRLADFVSVNLTEYNQRASQRNVTVVDELMSEVHRQRCWAAIHMNQNASQVAYLLLTSGNVSSQYASEIESAIDVVYESGRHYSALSQYVTKNLRTIQLSWLADFAPASYAYIAENLLTQEEQRNVIAASNTSVVNGGSVFSYLPSFVLTDMRPAESTVVLGPSELGLVYAQIFSFHQFNFSVDLHNSVRERLRFRHYLWYRILFSQVNHMVLSLVYALMTLAFRVSTSVTFGGSGFLVLWMTMYMFISASGGLNEAVCTLITFKDKKFLLPPWIIGTIVLNISPTFAPFVLSPGFYRYGYAIPMLNAYEALKVIFFNTWKGTLGRNYGVLAAWIVLTNIALCFILLYISRTTRKQKLNGKG